MSLSRLPPVNPPIGEAFAVDLSQGFSSALIVGDTGCGAIGKAEIEFVDIALQVRFGNVVIGTARSG